MSDNDPQQDLQPAARTRRSERLFKRSRAARSRKLQADKSDFKLISLILQLCTLGALLMVGAGVYVMRGMMGQGSRASGELETVSFFQPWIGPFSQLEIAVFALFALLALLILWRWRRKL